MLRIESKNIQQIATNVTEEEMVASDFQWPNHPKAYSFVFVVLLKAGSNNGKLFCLQLEFVLIIVCPSKSARLLQQILSRRERDPSPERPDVEKAINERINLDLQKNVGKVDSYILEGPIERFLVHNVRTPGGVVIPRVPAGGQPCLLIHDLGTGIVPNEVLNATFGTRDSQATASGKYVIFRLI